MNAVIDASFVLAFLLDDERTLAITDLAREIFGDGGIAPQHWQYEVANGVLMSVRRNRIDEAQADLALTQLARLRVTIERPAETSAWTSVYGLADRHGLTVYDAAYLELAQRRRMPLASLDRKLVAAARTLGVEVLTG